MRVRLANVVDNSTVKGNVDIIRPIYALEHIESKAAQLLADVRIDEGSTEDAVLVEKGDVVFGKLRPYLVKTLQFDAPAAVSSELLVLRPGNQIDHRYLSYLVLGRPFVQWAESTSYGVKMPRTSWDALKNFVFDLPPVSTQQRIADTLDRDLKRIEVLVTEQSRQKRLLAEHLDRVVDEHILGIAGLSAEKSVPLISLPRLQHVAEKVTVGIVITPSKWYVESGIPAIRGVNVRPGKVSCDDLVHLSSEGHRENLKSELRGGDVVVVRTGNAGAAAIVPHWMVGGNAIDLLLVRPGHKLLPEYLELALNSRLVQEQVKIGSVGALQAHFNTGSLKSVRLPAPEIDIQRQCIQDIGRVKSRVDELVGEIDLQSQLLAEHREALITAVVSGQHKIEEEA